MFTKAYRKLENLNIYFKTLSLLLLTISILFVNNFALVITIISILLVISYCFKDYESLQLSLILVLVSFFYYLHPFLLIIVKLMLFYNIYLVFKRMINKSEKRFLLDKIFYSIKTKKSMDIYLENCFKNQKFRKNLEVFNDMNYITKQQNINYIVKQAEIKTSYDLQDVYYRHKLSFYKFYNQKTSIMNFEYGVSDIVFIILSIVIVILAIITR